MEAQTEVERARVDEAAYGATFVAVAVARKRHFVCLTAVSEHMQ